MQDSKPALCPKPDGVLDFVHGGHCRICARFDEQAFLENRHAALFVFQSMLGNYVKMLYKAFDRDLIMALVMCEIWQYNFGRYFARYGHENATEILGDPVNRDQLLPPCNTYSISQVLGVPNETVRRKVKKLVARGWVNNGNGELVASKVIEEFFAPSLSLEAMRDFVSAARHVLAILDKEPKDRKSG
ncbi:MAG: hypothetical protein H6R18_741 [Proteobacteria bacterium]|nr:hypothetical protein [Pseudomonadota bacterium]